MIIHNHPQSKDGKGKGKAVEAASTDDEGCAGMGMSRDDFGLGTWGWVKQNQNVFAGWDDS